MRSALVVLAVALSFPSPLLAQGISWKQTRTEYGTQYDKGSYAVTVKSDKQAVMFTARDLAWKDPTTGKIRSLDQTIIVEHINNALVTFRGTAEKIEKTWVAIGRVDFDLFREKCRDHAKRELPLTIRKLIAERFDNAYELGEPGKAAKAP